MLHAILSESVVDLSAVHKGIEEVLHVPEGDADRLVLGKSNICNHKTHKTNQNKLFYSIIGKLPTDGFPAAKWLCSRNS